MPGRLRKSPTLDEPAEALFAQYKIWVIKSGIYARLTRYEKDVYTALHAFMSFQDKKVRALRGTLAKASGVHSSRISRATKGLAEAGLIQKKRTPGASQFTVISEPMDALKLCKRPEIAQLLRKQIEQPHNNQIAQGVRNITRATKNYTQRELETNTAAFLRQAGASPRPEPPIGARNSRINQQDHNGHTNGNGASKPNTPHQGEPTATPDVAGLIARTCANVNDIPRSALNASA